MAPPYRPVCGGGTPRVFISGCNGHVRASEQNIERNKNNTRVTDWACPHNPVSIKPYARLHSPLPTGGACPGPDGDCIVGLVDCDDPPGTIIPPCGPWPLLERVGNYFVYDAEQMINLSSCRKYGFKNVQSMKAWHGRVGFLSHDSPAGGCAFNSGDEDCPVCNIEARQDTADNTKYRTITATIAYTIVGADGWVVDTTIPRDETVYSGSVTVTVGRYTGTVKVTDCSLTKHVTTRDTEGNVVTDEDVVFAWPDFALAMAGYCDPKSGRYDSILANSLTDPDLFGVDDRTCENDYNHEAWWTKQVLTVFGSPVSVYEEQFEMTIELSDEYTAAELDADLESLLCKSITIPGDSGTPDAGQTIALWDLFDDKVYPWRQDGAVGIAPLVMFNENTAPTAPYIVTPDTEDGPGVSVNCGFEDPNSAVFDGKLMGAPLAAGYGPWFDYDHKTLRQCNGGVTVSRYLWAYGAFSSGRDGDGIPTGTWDGTLDDATDGYVPMTATLWRQNHDGSGSPADPWAPNCQNAGDLPSGAWKMGQGGVYRAQKWAIALVPRPSQNFFEPCGKTRTTVVSGSERCVNDFTDGVFTPGALVSPSDYDAGDTLLYYGGGSTCTLYPVLSSTSTTVTVDTGAGKSVTYNPFRTTTPFIGKVKFPSAWPICGRIAVAAAEQDGGNVNITLAEPAYWLATGDKLDFDSVGSLGDNVTVTVTDTTHIVVTGTLGSYTSGGFIKSHGAPAYWWDDEKGKGNCLLFEYGFNYRDIGEDDRMCAQAEPCECAAADPGITCPSTLRANQAANGMPRQVNGMTVTQLCLGATPCSPTVIVITPDETETPPAGTNGVAYAFEATYSFTPDDRHGARWQMAILQHRVDYTSEVPPVPCVEGSPSVACSQSDDWTEDSGRCDDGCYPQRRWVEAMDSVPAAWEDGDTPPTMLDGVTMHIVSLAELDASVPPSASGELIRPPRGYGYEPTGADTRLQPTAVQTPWGMLSNELICVCAETPGDYAGQYEEDGTKC